MCAVQSNENFIPQQFIFEKQQSRTAQSSNLPKIFLSIVHFRQKMLLRSIVLILVTISSVTLGFPQSPDGTSPGFVDTSKAIGRGNTEFKIAHSAVNASIGHHWDGPIRKCPLGHKNALNDCLRLILRDLKPRLAEGVPELNLPAMDPLRLKTVGFRHGTGPIKLTATFTNVEATGLSQYEQSEFSVDMNRRALTFDLGIPQMQLVGNYELAGNLFVFPIGGTGNFWLNLVGVKPKGRGTLEIIPNGNGQRTLQLKAIDLDLNIEGMKVHLTNLFNGDKFLGNVMNNFINENSLEIFAELRPQIARRVGDMVKVLTNKALGALSSQYLDDLPANL